MFMHKWSIEQQVRPFSTTPNRIKRSAARARAIKTTLRRLTTTINTCMQEREKHFSKRNFNSGTKFSNLVSPRDVWYEPLKVFLLRPLKLSRNFVFGCISVFLFFIFHAKSATTNNLRIDLSDISY